MLRVGGSQLSRLHHKGNQAGDKGQQKNGIAKPALQTIPLE